MKNKFKDIFIIFIIAILLCPFTVYGADNCNALFGSDLSDPNTVGYWIQLALDIMRYIAIIALIILSTLDFVKALVAQNNDALKKAYRTSIKRLIYCIIIFFVPGIVKLLFTLLGWYGATACEIGLE